MFSVAIRLVVGLVYLLWLPTLPACLYGLPTVAFAVDELGMVITKLRKIVCVAFLLPYVGGLVRFRLSRLLCL